uniref:G-protein coupled receptors family 1 profile domain-containing protein n=1 Tax=Megaselia scalaris TaxID=36166 RepID=T1H1Q2_MEGSC
MFLVFSFPPTIIQNGNWIDSENNSFLCMLNGFLFTILHPVALWTICGLNCDRFYAIAEPLHYCVIVTKRKVLMIARYHRHRIAAAIYEVTLSAQVTITHQRNPFLKFPPIVPNPIAPKVRLRSPITKIFQLVGSYFILYTPYFITIIWDSTNMIIFGDTANIPAIYKTNKYFVMMSVTLLTCSTVVNGILYGLKSKTIRKSFQNYRRKKRTKNEIQQEIQARTPSTCGSRQASMTNLGLLARPLLQRRLSETLVDIDKRPKIKRIASELTWRPISITFAGLEAGRANGGQKTQIVTQLVATLYKFPPSTMS